MDIASLSHSLALSLSLSLQLPIDRKISRSHITEIVPFLCFHQFTNGHSLSLCLSQEKCADLVLWRKHCFHVFTISQMDIASLSLSLSMQSPIDREISRCCIMEIVLFLCFHYFTIGDMDIASLSCSPSLSLSPHAICY